MTRLEARPDDDSVVQPLAMALEKIEPAERIDALRRAEAALDGRAEALAALGAALFRQNWPGCELAGARIVIAALRIDPGVPGAVSTLVRTFGYIADYDEVEPLVEEALDLTDRDPAILTTWARWLAAQDRPDDAQRTMHEAVSGWIARLTASPGDAAVGRPFAEALADVDEPERQDALDRVRELLAGRGDELVAFAGAVCAQSWPGCELAAARLVVAALRTGADAENAVIELTGALRYIADYDDVAPVVEEALQITNRDPALAASWSVWLAAHDRAEQAQQLAQEALPDLVTRLDAEPFDGNAARVVAAALGQVDPPERTDVLQRVRELLAARPADRVRFAEALFNQSWPGCELASARWLIDALRGGADARDVIAPIATTLGYIAGYDDAASVVDQALELTDRDPRLLAAWSRWLAARERSAEARATARDAVRGSEARLRADPADDDALGALSMAFPDVDQADRLESLRRIEGLLQDHSGQLVELGQALAYQDWPGSELEGVRLFVAGLRADPQNAEARAAIVNILDADRTATQQDLRPLVEQALELTGREPQLLAAWGPWLLADEQLQEAMDVALECLRRTDGELLPVHGDIADYLLARRHNAEAAHWLDRVSALAKEDVSIILRRAGLYRQQGQSQRAIEPLRAVLVSSDVADEIRWRVIDFLFSALTDLGRTPEIFDDLSALEADHPDVWSSSDYGRAAILEFRTRAALIEGDAGAAQRWLELTGEASRDLPWNIAPERLALLALQGKERLAEMEDEISENYRAACAMLDQALHRMPLRAQALARAERDGEEAGIRSALHFELGLELADLEHYSEAIEAYGEARAAWTEPMLQEGFWYYGPYSLHNTATAQENEGKYAAAVDTWRTVAAEYEAIATNDPYLAWARSIALFRLDRLTEAYDACVKGLDADPESIDLLSRLVSIDKAWQASWARRQAETSIEPDASRELRERLQKSCRWRSRDAARRLRRLLQDRAGESRAAAHHAAYADFLLERSELSGAHPHVLKAVSLEPDTASNQQLLARWHEARDEYREAVAAYSTAVELSPDDHEIHSQLAACHVKLGNTDAARGEFGIALAKAPAHVESLIGLADLHVDVGDKSQDDSNYDAAIRMYTDALTHHTQATGSKFLTSAEKAAIFYQRGYCNVQLYEAKPNVLRSRRLLNEALHDFRRCLAIDPRHEKARSAERKLTEKSSPFVRTARERYGPWLIVACTIFVFVVAQVKYVSGDIQEASHIALTFGSVALAIAGLFLPELLKLKVGGVELEKSPVEQERRPASFGLSR